ncbi:MAG: hypothetical protein ACFFCW_26655 [Candidatus Hodarchaeota archaeon]
MKVGELLNFVQGNEKNSPFPQSLTAEPEVISPEEDFFSEGEREINYNDDPCRKCRACGEWSGHEGGPFCFHDAIFSGNSSNPEPITKAREKCPRENRDERNYENWNEALNKPWWKEKKKGR